MRCCLSAVFSSVRNGRSSAAFLRTGFILKLFSLFSLLFQTVCAQESATVTLGWDASDSPGITAYRLYYGPQSGAYTNFLDFPVMLQGQVPGLAWGGPYYFAVTDVSSNGMESIPSNEVSYRLPQSDVEPTISDLWDRVTAQDVPIAIPFQLNAAEATDPNLTFSAWSSDPNLVPIE